MGAPDPIQQQWIGDTIQTATEQGIDKVDLGKQLLLSLAEEFGYWKLIAVVFLFVLASVGGTIFGAIKFMRRKGA